MKKGPKQKIFVGDVFTTTNYDSCTVESYEGIYNILVRFTDGTLVKTESSALMKGCVRNPNHPTICGLGYSGVGEYSSKTHPKIYQTWRSMFFRCYESLEHNPTYEECYVSITWYNFQNFADWFIKNSVESWELDKDILVKSNKEYGPDTCCFVPKELNNIFRDKRKSGSSLPAGVSKLPSGNYQSHSSLGGQKVYLGSFNTVEGAKKAQQDFVRTKVCKLLDKYFEKMSPKLRNSLYYFIYDDGE